MEVATLAGGCFWCLEAVFSELKGVDTVVPGYSGGTFDDPSYEEVCTGRTGHAEAVQVTYNPNVISYRDLLGVFLSIHDPTTLNRQGDDVGTQYRSAIFYHDEVQRAVAVEIIGEFEAAKIWGTPIVTAVTPFEAFYPAEDYHKDYFVRNRGKAYCRLIIEPKVQKFRGKYLDRLKKSAAG